MRHRMRIVLSKKLSGYLISQIEVEDIIMVLFGVFNKDEKCCSAWSRVQDKHVSRCRSMRPGHGVNGCVVESAAHCARELFRTG